MSAPPEPRTEPAAGPADRLRGAGHRLLPTRLLSALTRRLARIRRPALKDRLNRLLVRRHGLDLGEAMAAAPEAYPSLNALFTRALRPGARPLPEDPRALACPCDGTVSAAGHLDGEQLLQAKGLPYTVAELLGGLDPAPFRDGAFVTLYLSPRDYHRFHAPLDARLMAERHVPGRLLTVAPAAVRSIPGLFVRNERHVTCWQTAAGPLAYIPVGAVNVGSIETAWGGEVGDPPGRRRDYPGGQGPRFQRGDELGRFNLGSTIILILPAGTVAWADDLEPGRRVRMGEAIGRLAGCPAPGEAGDRALGDRGAAPPPAHGREAAQLASSSTSSASSSEVGAPETPLR